MIKIDNILVIRNVGTQSQAESIKDRGIIITYPLRDEQAITIKNSYEDEHLVSKELDFPLTGRQQRVERRKEERKNKKRKKLW